MYYAWEGDVKQDMDNALLFTNTNSVSSNRIIYTPSAFARSSLIHLQETGTLQATHPHKNERSGLSSCLFFTVLSGDGRLTYDGEIYTLHSGDCVFIDCKKPYSHETGSNAHQEQVDTTIDATIYTTDTAGPTNELWSLQWVHFYGPNMGAIYRKYQERGGKPVFRTSQLNSYHDILDELYNIASSPDYVRDMRIHEKLSSLLILLMEDAWDDMQMQATPDTLDIQEIKDYLDENFKRRISLDDLAGSFYLNKYYLMKLFKERYGMTINAYLNQARVTWVKQQLRFTDKTVEMLAAELQIEPAYLSRLFKKVEGVSPTSFRKSWRGK